ncbi:MAG: HAD-IG family 5'-nucleotidase [Planctomycetota bacterium]
MAKDSKSNQPSDAKPSESSTKEVAWWNDVLKRAVQSPVFDSRRQIFTNRTLRFDKIKAVGFDFDHTLAVYNCEALDAVAMRLVIERLRADGFSEDFEKEIPDPDFACKGLIVDTKLGTVLKVDRFGHVLRAFRGKNPLPRDERRVAYGDMNVIPMETDGERFRPMDTAFAKPDILIFSALSAVRLDEDCTPLWKKVREHTDMVHRDGSLKKIIMKSPLDFLNPDLEVLPMLQQLRASGKKVFLLTNSEWEYTRAMVNPAFGLGDDPSDLGWVDLFDFVVCHARKPRYFDPTGATAEKAIPEDHRILVGGCIRDIEAHLGYSGPEVLYVGDHIYADLITSKLSQNWRTMLIISELEEEIDAQAGLPGIARQINDADLARLKAESMLHHWEGLAKTLESAPDDRLIERAKADIARLIRQEKHDLRHHIDQREKLRDRMSRATNRFWGSHFRASNELTFYGRQIEDYGCIYSSRAANLGVYPPDHYFRSPMDYLPHELATI